MRAFLEDGMQPVLDPLFDDKARLIKGCRISNVKELIEKEKSKITFKTTGRETGFKEGQKVEVIFPDRKMPKQMIGFLTTDEFVDEQGEICAIFTPIEDGKPTEFAFKMPVKLFIILE